MDGVDTSFIVEAIQLLVLALGLAFAFGNGLALARNRSRTRAYEDELAAWKRARKKGGAGGDRGPKPTPPELAPKATAVTAIVIGLAIALLAFASLNAGWI